MDITAEVIEAFDMAIAALRRPAAAIVPRLSKDGNPRARATSTNCGNGKYVLNYCPMCGRKLEVEG